MAGVRLDQLMVQRGLADGLDLAQRLIHAGKVKVAGQPAGKPGHTYPADAELGLEAPERFVSRGGEKLEGAFQYFQLSVQDEICLDAGASTGGFTDCLLQHGARRVYAVDVGHHQLHAKLVNEPRVVVMDGLNARLLKPTQFPEPPTFTTVDASFISLRALLPVLVKVMVSGGRLLTLIKPQFEAAPADVTSGGVVRDPAVHERVIQEVKVAGERLPGLQWQGVCTSPLRGPAGNVEYLAYWKLT